MLFPKFFQLIIITGVLFSSACWKRNYNETSETPPDRDELEVWDEIEEDPIIVQPSIWDITKRHRGFSTFSELVEAAGLEETFKSDLRFTLLAPTDEAFDELPEGSIEELLKEENKLLLVELLLNHVIPEVFHSADLMDGETATALSGHDLIISKDNEIRLSNATVTTADINASNGVVHIVDQVITGE